MRLLKLACFLVPAAALLGVAAPASALPMAPVATGPVLTTQVAWPCPPGYHLGRGGQRCWPNGYAPVEEIPLGYVPPPPVSPMMPVLECPPGYHLGQGRQRCWPN